MVARNLLHTKPANMWKLTDWELLDLYAQRHLLDSNTEYAVKTEVNHRSDNDAEFAYEASRR